MIDRVLKNWKTTLVGLLIIMIAGASVYLDKATLTEAGAFIGVGLGLFFMKDKNNDL